MRALRYIAIGASDSVGIGASDPATKSWPALLSARLPRGSSYLNLAVSGSTVAQATREQLPRAAGVHAEVITVWLAVNDLNAGLAPAGYRAQLARLLDGLRPNGARVFVGTVPDLTKVPAYADLDAKLLSALVNEYNEAIGAVVRESVERAVAVDLTSGSEVIVRESVVAPDGFHPNDRGYELIAQRFIEVMRANGVPVS